MFLNQQWQPGSILFSVWPSQGRLTLLRLQVSETERSTGVAAAMQDHEDSAACILVYACVLSPSAAPSPSQNFTTSTLFSSSLPSSPDTSHWKATAAAWPFAHLQKLSRPLCLCTCQHDGLQITLMLCRAGLSQDAIIRSWGFGIPHG